jgi:hypothetical protein
MLFSNPEMAEVSYLFPGWSGDLSFLNSHAGSPLRLSALAAGSIKNRRLRLLDLAKLLHGIIGKLHDSPTFDGDSILNRYYDESREKPGNDF